MSAQHTPGPWTAHPEGCAHVPPYVRVAKYWPQAGAFQIIADCSYVATHGSECEANARLIAAAPELLAALKDAHGHLEHMAKFIADQKLGYSFESLGEDIGNIRDAIAKAEGRS